MAGFFCKFVFLKFATQLIMTSCGCSTSPGDAMTYRTSAFVFMVALAFALGLVMVLPVVSNNRVRSDRLVAESSELASAQLSRVRLVISR
jgi:hypothetical protein